MTKPILSRRRSNSSAGGGGGSADGKSNHNADTAASRGQRRSGREVPGSASRPKRRSRGLPLTRPKQRDTTDTGLETTRSSSASSNQTNDERKLSHNNQKDSVETRTSMSNSKLGSATKNLSSSRENNLKSKKTDPPDDDSSEGATDALPVDAVAIPEKRQRQKQRDRVASSTPKSMHLSRPQALIARDEDGNDFPVRIIVNSQTFVNQAHSVGNLSRKRSRQDHNSTSNGNISTNSNGNNSSNQASASGQGSFLGHDGNLFHCHVCHGFGDVVCCDGCPHVYHPKCIPEGDPSRQSLENDDEPWFCPSCFKAKKKSKPDVTTSAFSSPLETRSSNSQPHHGEQRRTVKRRCCECHQSGGPNSLEPCDGCGTYLHFPSCRGTSPATPNATSSSTTNSGSILCSTCRSERALVQEENDIMREKKKRKSDRQQQRERERQKQRQQRRNGDGEARAEESEGDNTAGEEPGSTSKSRRKTRSLFNDDMQMDDEASADDMSQELSRRTNNDGDEEDLPIEHEDDHSNAGTPATESKKRRRPSLTASPHSGTPSKPEKKKKSDKKKKKKKKLAAAEAEKESSKADPVDAPEEDMPPYQPMNSSLGMAKATPAFYFFLGENRFKIERVLARKHKYFNRLPKGVERNELVAREGAFWWIKLRPTDTRRYMNLSMRDFEQRIIEWKEEKNIRDMMMETDIEDTRMSGTEVKDLSPDDEMLTYLNHDRLYLGTTVGSKPFKPDAGTSHNRVLLELLQDMRFHPVPMFSANRTDAEYGQMDFSRITIPYFDVHGPVSTSVGDECLGCARGWTHFCNVLSRRIPAVEHRARLQPPLSSLMATRIGLGLRPRAMPPAKQEETEEEGRKVEPFTVRDVAEAAAARNLPIVPWDSMTDPSSRADDIVQFIEEAVSMKVPEPPRPVHPSKNQSDSSKKAQLARGALPIRGRKRTIDSLSFDSSESNKNLIVNKCGRCRTVIQTDTGCIQCRRAQLVINMSKRVPREVPVSSGSKSSKNESKRSKLVKVQTYMLGRVTMKEGSGEVQSKGDQAVSDGILRQRWTPYAILPPQTLEAPTPKPRLNRRSSEDSQESAFEEGSESSGDQGVADASKVMDVMKESNDDRSDTGNEDVGGDDEKSRHSSKRLRSARIVAAASTSHVDVMDESDRQRLAERHKEEAKELQKKTLSVACCGILLALMRRDPLLLFASPVTAEGYSAIVKNPIDFGKIRANVLAGKYGTLGSFVADARLLCTNALAYNPPGSIYWKTAKELYDVLAVMQKRASNWMGAIRDAHAFAWRRAPRIRKDSLAKDDDDVLDEVFIEDPFDQLRKNWPEAVEMLETSDWLRKCITADFMRTKENETAYYGSLAVRRAAVAAEASLAPYPDTGGLFATVSKRSHIDDENLRRLIDERVSDIIDPVELKDLPTWREESIVRVMRRTQSRRLEGRIGSINGCARCDGVRVDQELKMAMTAETVRWGRSRRKGDEVPRVSPSRIDLSTGLASQKTRERIDRLRNDNASKASSQENFDSASDVAVSVRGSRIHGWGLFADQPFKKGDVVAEYLGEYVSLAVTEAREKIYQEQRIQDYQFRLDESLVIDATMRGGHGRYINHNCNPNCLAKTILGKPPNQHLKRVIIIAQRDIEPREELTYDYQFPLELDLDARIPCNCQSEHCRGFMNWDLPEKGSNNRVLRSQKRGANMRDRIRRLGRPLKSDK